MACVLTGCTLLAVALWVALAHQHKRATRARARAQQGEAPLKKLHRSSQVCAPAPQPSLLVNTPCGAPMPCRSSGQAAPVGAAGGDHSAARRAAFRGAPRSGAGCSCICSPARAVCRAADGCGSGSGAAVDLTPLACLNCLPIALVRFARASLLIQPVSPSSFLPAVLALVLWTGLAPINESASRIGLCHATAATATLHQRRTQQCAASMCTFCPQFKACHIPDRMLYTRYW